MKSIVLGVLCLLVPAVWTQALQPLFVASGFSYVQDNYAVSTVAKMNWFQAEAFCAAQGYTLVSIPDDLTQYNVFLVLLNSNLQRVLTEPIWTSGTNQAVSNQWNWFSTGAIIDYRNFQRDPSNSYSCLALNAGTGKWSAVNCSDQRYFICQTKCPAL